MSTTDPTQDGPQDRACGRDWTAVAIEWASGATAVAMFALAAIVLGRPAPPAR